MRSVQVPRAWYSDPEILAFARGVLGELPVKSVTAAYSALTTDSVVLVDCTAGAVTVTLPKAADCKGCELNFKKTDASANAMTVDGNGSETIDGAANVSTTTRYASYTVHSDGANWGIF